MKLSNKNYDFGELKVDAHVHVISISITLVNLTRYPVT